MTIKNNPTITFNETEHDTLVGLYQWLCDMGEEDFYTLGAEVKNVHPDFDIDKLFNLLDDFTDFMDDRVE